MSYAIKIILIKNKEMTELIKKALSYISSWTTTDHVSPKVIIDWKGAKDINHEFRQAQDTCDDCTRDLYFTGRDHRNCYSAYCQGCK